MGLDPKHSIHTQALCFLDHDACVSQLLNSINKSCILYPCPIALHILFRASNTSLRGFAFAGVWFGTAFSSLFTWLAFSYPMASGEMPPPLRGHPSPSNIRWVSPPLTSQHSHFITIHIHSPFLAFIPFHIHITNVMCIYLLTFLLCFLSPPLLSVFHLNIDSMNAESM